jgi:hypothetical protein
MRRLAGVLASVGFTLGLVALPATALAQTTSPTTSAASGSLNERVSGPFTGTGTIYGEHPPCPASLPVDAYHQVFDGTYTAVKNGRTGSFHLDGCTNFGDTVDTLLPFPFSGTFTLTAPNGATMSGTAAGLIGGARATPYPYALRITLTPTGGAKKFANVGGVVSLTGTWQFTQMAGVPGPISGSLAGALTH